MEPKKPNRYSLLRQASLLATIPAILAVGPVIGYFLGHFLDGKLSTDPYLTYLLIILGFVASGREVYQIAKKANAPE